MTTRTEIAEEILRLVEARGPEKSICPSEVVRSLRPDDWRDWMSTCREVCRDLAREGRIEICRKGQPVDPGSIRGPIRLRLAEPG